MDTLKVRQPVAAGSFYPASGAAINKIISSFAVGNQEKTDAIACILPHAGYVYSGRVAVLTASGIKLKDRIIILGPNHTGLGKPYSVMAEGVWVTPVGNFEIDSTLAKKIIAGSRFLKEDSLAHASEHSLEVELPILKFFKDDFKILPVAISSNDLGVLKQIGKDIAFVIKSEHLDGSVSIVASSDMTHYESQVSAQKKDSAAIKAIEQLDEDKLAEVVNKMDISMCGVAPVIVLLSAVKELGAKKAELVLYETSGEVTGDRESVVGYAGLIIK